MSDKLYRIGEAAALLNLKSYVLRFWETEFPQLEPVRTDKGQRLYTEEHVELLKLIKHLLHERGLTIDGARRILKSQAEPVRLSDNLAANLAGNLAASLPNILPEQPEHTPEHTSGPLPEPLPEPLPKPLTDQSNLSIDPLANLLPGSSTVSLPDSLAQVAGQVAAQNNVPGDSTLSSPNSAHEIFSAPSASFCPTCAQSIERAENAEEIARHYELILDEFILELEELKALLTNGSSSDAATPGSGINGAAGDAG